MTTKWAQVLQFGETHWDHPNQKDSTQSPPKKLEARVLGDSNPAPKNNLKNNQIIKNQCLQARLLRLGQWLDGQIFASVLGGKGPNIWYVDVTRLKPWYISNDN
jgi:hypothetical protein